METTTKGFMRFAPVGAQHAVPSSARTSPHVRAPYNLPLQDTRFHGSKDWFYQWWYGHSPVLFDLHKRGDAGDALPNHQLVNVVCAFVGEHTFEVVHVPHDALIVPEAVRARMSRAFRAVSSAIATLFIFSMEMCDASTLPLSFSRPTCSASNWPFTISVIIHANFSCTSWCDAMGLFANCFRVFAYCNAVS